MLMDEVYRETRICATAGVGTNLFLAKVALDIQAKHEGEPYRRAERRALPYHDLGTTAPSPTSGR